MKHNYFLIAILIAGLLIVLVIPASAAITKTTSFFEDGGNNYTIIKWTTNLGAGAGQDSTTWDAGAAGVSEVQYLVVAGGGGAARASTGNLYLGGGGAGGMREGTEFAVSGTITIKVGAGGARPTDNAHGTQGANSQFSTIESVGGGYGGYADEHGGDGGSGGGAGGNDAATTGGAATSGQGSAGGNHAAGSATGGAGGGGAGGAGGANSGTTGGTGGAAKASSITGSSVYYAGGGYGGAGNAGSVGSDGTGYSRAGYGMGGRGDTSQSGYGSGTNGVVVIRYLTPPPHAITSNFTASNTSGLQPLLVQFTDTSTTSDATIDAWMWDFGDGDTSTDQNPDHTYVSAGTYDVNLTITNTSYSLVSTKLSNITVYNRPPIADFTASNLSGTPPLLVQFADTSAGVITNRYWDFGDGNTSSLQNPEHTFESVGEYQVNLTVTNDGGSSTKLQNITVYEGVTVTQFFNTTGNSSYTVPYGVNSIHLILVGGGGGGAAPTGGTGGGGGGAGGVVDTTYNVAPGETYNVYVGAGGSAGHTGGTLPTRGVNSTFNNATSSIIAYGGGRGDASGGLLSNGSSGGGTRLAPAGYAVYGSQGYNGYVTGQTSSPFTAGGGGGAGGAASSQTGGACYNVTLTSGTISLAAGGGGGSYNGANTISMCGIGGIGAKDGGQTAGVANTGSGGGGYGGTSGSVSAGAGGSGTAIISYIVPELVSTFTTNYTAPLFSPPDNAIRFTDQSAGLPTSWSWRFNNVTGNNTIVEFATTQNPVHLFGIGNFSISLNASTSENYDISTQSTWINISAIEDVPIPRFTSTNATGDVPLTVTFTDTSLNYPSTWNWSFGDGYVSSLQNPTHTYNTPGIYSINLTESNPAGFNSTVFVDYVNVIEIFAGFSADVTMGPIPLTVHFTGSSTDSPDAWYWEFGDNGTSTLQNPTHIYSTAGNYSVSMRASNISSGSFAWHNKTNFIQAIMIAPVSDFGATPTSGTVPLNVTFTDTTQNDPDTWLWEFGDGYTSTTRNTSHVYNATGIYNVNLTTSNAIGSNKASKTNYITINPMIVTFSSDNTIGSYYVDAQFTASSTGSPNTWYWEFGDGNTSTLQNPFHQYNSIGNYDVNLKVTNTSSGAFTWENKTSYIQVTGMLAPLASFTMSLTNSYVPMTVSFTDTSTNTPSSWLWDFGDGNTSITQNPVFTYNVPGTYEVSLTATNIIGSNTSTFKYLVATEVPLQPQANFSWSNTQGVLLPVTVQFTDLSTQSPTSWYWSDFGDGSGETSLLQNPTHNYTSVGAFPVTLSVTNINGTPSQITKYVQVTSTTGGVTSTTTTVGAQTIETLSGFGSYAWTCPSGVYSVSALLVGGGGAGTNGGTTSGASSISFSGVGGAKGSLSTITNYGVTPGQVYQFVVGKGGDSARTNISTANVQLYLHAYISRNNIAYADSTYGYNNYYTSDPLSGGYTYAFGSTASGGGGGTQTFDGGINFGYASGSALGIGTNGQVSSISGVFTTYGGSGGGTGYIGGTQGGGNGYGYLGGASTAGSFYGAGGGAGDNVGGGTDSGSDGDNGVIILNYNVNPVILPPVANFTATPLSGTHPLTVQFTDYSTNGPTSWSWTFGDGGTSTEKNPSHTYNSAGLYTVTLTDYNTNTTGSGSLVRTNYINVTDPIIIPTPTPGPQSSTVWFVPKTVQFVVVDTSGNIVPGAIINAHFISSASLPGGVQDLLTYYGMNEAAANNAVNGTLIMNSTADTNGQSVLTMLQTLTYNVTVSYGSTTNIYTINPQDSSYQLKLVAPTSTINDEYTCVLSNGNTWTGAYSNINDDAYNITLMFSYQDTCGLTDSITFYVYDKGTEVAPIDVLSYTTTVSPVTTDIYKLNVTVPNTRGQNYVWLENYTRSV